MLPTNKINSKQIDPQPKDFAQNDSDLHLLKALYRSSAPDLSRNDPALTSLRTLSYLCLVKCNTQEEGLKIGYFPLINSIENVFMRILKTHSKNNENNEVFDFFTNLLKYKKNDPTGLTAQLQILRETKPDPQSKDVGMEILRTCAAFLMRCSPDQLERTHVSIWGGKNRISPERGFYTAVESCKHLCKRLKNYLGLAELKMIKVQQERKTVLKNQTDSIFLNQLFCTISSLIQNNTQLDRHQKICIYKSFCRIVKNYTSHDARHHGHASLSIGLDICQNYVPIILGFPCENAKAETVSQNKELFQSFVPRMGEFVEDWLSADRFFMKYCPILMELPLYLKFGDLSKLNSQLKKIYRFGEIDQVLCTEVENFAKQKDKDLHLEGIETARKLLSIMDEFHMWRERLICALFDSPLGFAEKCHPALLWSPPEKKEALPAPSPSGRRKKNKTNSALPVPVKEELAPMAAENPNIVKEPSYTVRDSKIGRCQEGDPNLSQAEPTPKQTNLKSLSRQVGIKLGGCPTPAEPIFESRGVYLEEVEVAHKNILESLKRLKGCIKHAEADKALRNAQSHFEHILCTFSQFMPSLEKGVSRGQLHAFVIDCVRYASLTSEQMLLALASVSNETKIELSHDLYRLLSFCKFKAGPLPPALRTFIRNNNKGEIDIRSLMDCQWEARSDQKVPSLDQLLNKLRLFSIGQEAFTPAQLLQDTIEFCQFSGQLFYTIETQLNAAARTPIPAFQEISSRHNQQFSSLCTFLSQLASNAVIRDSSSQTTLPFTRKKLEMLGQDPHLDNVCKHLLPHLEVEMQNATSLSPLRAHLHLCNVLLSNQLIAEEVLFYLNNLKLSFLPPAEDHDLLALVKALGIPETLFSKEELIFLQSGKMIRQLVRYPAHSSPANSKDSSAKLLEAGAQLFFSQKFTETYAPEDGFQKKNSQVPSRLAQVKNAALQDVALLDSVLSKVILALEI